MKKLFLSITAALFILFGGVSTAQADDYLRVGMEAAYAPFNWTQNDNSNGAVKIEGTNQYANGYDVQIAKKIASALNKKVLVVKTKWEGLVPALTSGKIDMIIAGMSPTEERKKEIAFSDAYYISEPTLVVNSKGKYANATKLSDFKGAKVTAQQGVYLYDLISQINGVQKEVAMGDFTQLRQAVESGIIDAYVSERPDALSAQNANPNLKMITLKDGFNTSESDTNIAVGLRKNDPIITKVNKVLDGISKTEQINLMDDMISRQPATVATDEKSSFFKQVVTIFKENWQQFLRGTGITLLISIVGTIVGLFIGLLIGVYRTAPIAANRVLAILQKAFGWLLNVYIEIFRGTPMIVQAMVIYYGAMEAFNIDMSPFTAGLFVVSINTGAYMAETVRGGIDSIDIGQTEGAKAIGMTHFQIMLYVILPQTLRNIMPQIGNNLIINIKDTSVLNVISVSELYFVGKSASGVYYKYFEVFFIICIIYFVMNLIVSRILRFIEKKMDGPSDYKLSGSDFMSGEI